MEEKRGVNPAGKDMGMLLMDRNRIGQKMTGAVFLCPAYRKKLNYLYYLIQYKYETEGCL